MTSSLLRRIANMANEQHIYHHNDSDGVRINVSVEQNSRSTKYGATVVGAKTVEEAIRLLKETKEKLDKEYAEKTV